MRARAGNPYGVLAENGSRLVTAVPTAVVEGPDGASYVSELSGVPFAAGAAPVIIDGLDRPTSVAVGSEGEMYVTNHGITPGIGEVLRICR